MYQDFKQLGIPAPSYTILQSWQSGAVLCCWDLQLGEDVVANARKKVQDIITLGSYRKHQIAEIKVLSPWLISPSNSRTEYDSSGAADALPTSHKRALSTSADTLPAELKRRRVSGYIDGKLQNWVSRASAVTAITHTTVRSEDFFSGSSHRRARSLQSGSLGRAESITGGSLSVVYEGDNINPPSGGSISRSVASRHLNHLGLATDDAMSSTGQPGDRSATAAGGLPSAKSHSANAIVPASASPQAPDNDSDVSYMGSQLSDVSAALAFSTLSAPLLIDSEDLVSGVPAILPSSNTATGSAEDSDDQRLQDLNTALVNRVNDNSIQIIALLAEKRGTLSPEIDMVNFKG
ncbi:uncharacterized protein B0H18DRAFT_1123012 [Fomitopsis serialis]|uniref:uncharacterized protein n=1 Tax=Fomitopsis serialis TaxID=139415 RepID=UPI002007D311|nr:uncharacterized protein B0H18DRAFT_1123012 [Neoantrodia serialis]KAH9918503.1 hypothetical protein B0H18DRAFT_1123012 [Neoantrodia serialis]